MYEPFQQNEDITGPTCPSNSRGLGLERTGLLAPGVAAGPYEVRRMINRGGCGIVYEGTHRDERYPVAIKVLRSELTGSPEMVERFIREARVIDQIRHPNIVRIFYTGRLADGRPFLVMELLEGSSLNTLCREHGAFAPDQVVALLRPVCAALEAAHTAGFIHRDLKSSNIVVSSDRARVTLLDFGIAKLLHPRPSESGLTSAGHPLGTPHSMAPEQIVGGAIDARTDVYALGILTYELLTAALPFESEHPAEIERMHLRAAPPRPSENAPVSPEVDEVVLRCLAKEVDARYDTPSVFLAALTAAVGGEHTGWVGEAARPRVAVGVLVRTEFRTAPAEGSRATPEAMTEATPEATPEAMTEAMTEATPEAMPEATTAATTELDDVDDDVVELCMEVLDLGERTLAASGFSVPLQTGDSVLGIKLLADAGDATDPRQRAGALALARRLYDDLGELAGPGERTHGVCVVVTVHVDRLLVSTEPREGERFTGGELLRVADWPVARGRGVRATAAALDGLGPEIVARFAVS